MVVCHRGVLYYIALRRAALYAAGGFTLKRPPRPHAEGDMPCKRLGCCPTPASAAPRTRGSSPSWLSSAAGLRTWPALSKSHEGSEA